ncbi:O-methyltransferase [Halalkalibacter krulwichiae]|uniref:Putative O-methyltransferase/MSMEI_4947 n=1 Tax=Halalkalibacter krulwichiae TaxID=199441 RepID=A0A1X9MB06_9BACI|nr:O-methyltransferase [Halalkalibacter krulwichiae]ARK29824.1 Putative O-methyltransferase/MSMEI_4947 [Halalkalibacter krulwichiae]
MKQMNEYIDSLFTKKDILLEEVITSIEAHDMPSISVSPSSGKLLTMLISISKAKSVLEIGALGGYSGICLARGFGEKGKLTSLELKEEYAELAYENVKKAGFGHQVTYMTGEALHSLEQLAASNQRFDFFFIDADKGNYEHYLEYCIQLAEPNALIVTDNVLQGGSVADPECKTRRHTEFMKEFNKKVASHPQLDSLIVPIGDGLTVSVVKK